MSTMKSQLELVSSSQQAAEAAAKHMEEQMHRMQRDHTATLLARAQEMEQKEERHALETAALREKLLEKDQEIELMARTIRAHKEQVRS